jgi:hypothetical protein
MFETGPARRPLFVLGTALAITALAACSSPSAPTATKPSVATLVTAEATVSATPRPTKERPRERLDMTQDEREALYVPYEKCMTKHGVPSRKLTQAGTAPASDATLKKASKACDQLIPLPPWEKDDNNPQAKDFERAVTKCLQKNGIKIEIGADGTPGLGGSSADVAKGLGMMGKCEKEAAATL